MKRVALSVALVLTMATAGEQFAMSNADRAMYEEMLENNPADIFVEEGERSLKRNWAVKKHWQSSSE